MDILILTTEFLIGAYGRHSDLSAGNAQSSLAPDPTSDIYPEDCSVCQMPYFKIYISCMTCEMEDCLLFMLIHGLKLNYMYLFELTCVLKKL